MPTRNRLEQKQIEAALRNLPGWTASGDRLTRAYRFPDFVRAWAFMSAAALHAQAMNHHPNWSNAYGTVEVTLWTHDAGGVTEMDLTLAGRFEELAKQLGAADTVAEHN